MTEHRGDTGPPGATAAAPVVPAGAAAPFRPTTRSMALDVGLAGAGLLVVAGMALQDYRPVVVLLSAVEIAPLALRRLRPRLSFAVIAVAMLLQLWLVDVPLWGQVALPISVYSMAAHAPRRDSRLALAAGLLGGLLGPADWLSPVLGGQVGTAAGLFLVTELLVITPWSVGTLMRTRRAYVATLLERSRRLEREAAMTADLAASDERARIAREMHDVVAHGLSVMIVQADGASYARDPALATQALETISSTGRESLAEMRRLLGLLRTGDGADPTGNRPQPGVADLPHLLDHARATGMSLTDRVGELPVVSPGVGLTVYRLVQEALTNVRKHAGAGASATVSIRHDGSALHVEVADDGHGPGDGPTDGHGLLGMRERVATHGGTLATGARPGGGFLLQATVPTEEPR